MSIRNPQREELLRLELKTLEGRFRTMLQEGLNCSAFEAEAVVGAVREVYFPWIDEASTVGPPGRVVLVAVAADEPAGKSVADCAKQTVSLLVHRGGEDDRLLQSQGPTAFRRQRLPDLCQQALSQGALLTREDLAYRIFFVSPRTISRDLAGLRDQNPPPPLPLRSLVISVRSSPPACRSSAWPWKARPPRRFAAYSATPRRPWPITFPPSPAVHSWPPATSRPAKSLFCCAAAAPSSRSTSTCWPSVKRIQLWPTTSSNSSSWAISRGEKNPPQGGPMLAKTDFLRKKYAPLQERNLQQALAQLLGREFPRLGGDRILQLCAEMIRQFLDQHLRPRENVGHGQVLWLAISTDHPPAPGQRLADTHLLPVVLDLVTADDLQARLDRQAPAQRLRTRAVRLCQQAHRQGALLSNCDLATLLNTDDSQIATQLGEHERQTGSLVPWRATLHDVGTCLTHKRLICWKRYAEGKDPHLVARETYHTLEAVDRYLGQFDRVRYCARQGMSPQEIAYTLNCSQRLVEEYLEIDRALGGPA